MGEEFQVWDSEDARDAGRWLEVWRAWPRREVFAHPDYAGLYRDEKTRPLCASWQSADGWVLYPFLARDLSREAFFPPGLGAALDVTTPYGYGGPFFWGEADPDALAAGFWPRFDSWAGQNAVVSEFVRFALDSGGLLPYPGQRQELTQNVIVDLTQPEESLWMGFAHKIRKNVNKAKRSGLLIEADAEGRRLEEFLRVYYATMNRRGAGEAYYFQRSYFERLIEKLGGQFVFFHVLHEGRMVSTELVLVSAETIYSFLGGTQEASFELRPNDFLKFEIIRWGRANGKKRFVLGGGYEPGDGIFQYKKSFAPGGCVPYRVGRRILNPALYLSIIESRRAFAERSGSEWRERPNFFPAYRA